MLDRELLAGVAKLMGAVATAVIGEQSADGKTMPGEELAGAVEEAMAVSAF